MEEYPKIYCIFGEENLNIAFELDVRCLKNVTLLLQVSKKDIDQWTDLRSALLYANYHEDIST